VSSKTVYRIAEGWVPLGYRPHYSNGPPLHRLCDLGLFSCSDSLRVTSISSFGDEACIPLVEEIVCLTSGVFQIVCFF